MNDLFEPVPALLSYNVENERTKEQLNAYSAALNKLVAIGTHLIEWELNPEEENTISINEVTVVSLLFKRLLELTDSIAQLMRIGSVVPAVVLLRTLFELKLSFEFLLKSDTAQKCRCVLITDLYRDLDNYKEPNRDDRKNELLHIIESPGLSDEKAEYIRLRAKPDGTFKNVELKWYNLFTQYNNLADLAKGLDKGQVGEEHYDLYRIVYQIVGSNAIHSTDLLKGNLVLEDGNPALEQMRNPDEALEVTQLTFSIVKDACELIVKRRNKKRYQEYVRAILTCEKIHKEVAYLGLKV